MSAIAPTSPRPSETSYLLRVITAVVIVAALYFGKELVVPFAFAVLLSFLLSTPVGWLERLHCPRLLSVFLVLLLTFTVAGTLAWIGFQQLSGIIESLPQYQSNLVDKIHRLHSSDGGGLAGTLQKLDQMETQVTANQLESEKKGNPAEHPIPGQARHKVAPIPVEIVKPSGLLPSLGIAGSAIAPYLAMALSVVVLTLFMLLNRGNLRNRVLRLFGQGQVIRLTTTLDDAAQRVSRYLLTQTLINSVFGTLLGIGLYFIGVPYAPFWAGLAAILRFVPYVGTFVAGLCPFVLSIIIFDDWKRPLLTLALYSAIELTTSSLIEPWLFATRTGISSIAILISAAFWTLLWGPIGLVLATPLTVCLAVLGRHLPPLEFLYVLLGDEPVLTPEVCYYQRLLATDDEDASAVLETALKEKSLLEVYDTILIPALGMAETDRHDKRLDEERSHFILQTTHELTDELEDRLPPPHDGGRKVICIPARDEADALIADMLSQLLRSEGCEIVGNEQQAEFVVVSALPPFALLQARSRCRQIRKRTRTAKILLGVWNSPTPAEEIQSRLGTTCADIIVTTLAEALTQIRLEKTPQAADFERNVSAEPARSPDLTRQDT